MTELRIVTVGLTLWRCSGLRDRPCRSSAVWRPESPPTIPPADDGPRRRTSREGPIRDWAGARRCRNDHVFLTSASLRQRKGAVTGLYDDQGASNRTRAPVDAVRRGFRNGKIRWERELRVPCHPMPSISEHVRVGNAVTDGELLYGTSAASVGRGADLMARPLTGSRYVWNHRKREYGSAARRPPQESSVHRQRQPHRSFSPRSTRKRVPNRRTDREEGGNWSTLTCGKTSCAPRSSSKERSRSVLRPRRQLLWELRHSLTSPTPSPNTSAVLNAGTRKHTPSGVRDSPGATATSRSRGRSHQRLRRLYQRVLRT